MKTVLIVDDDSMMRKTVSMIIKKAHPDAIVLLASNGAEALEMVNSHGDGKFDLVVSDHLMPVMDGVELVKRIRAAYPDTRIILMSGTGESKHHQAHAFLAKPFGRDEFLETIQRLMGNRKAK